MQNASNCVIELIGLARKNEKFASINDVVLSKVELLVQKVDQAVAARDEELAEQLQDIFVELGSGHLEKIIETQTLTIPQILLKLMTVPDIRSREQTPFWKNLFKSINKI
jgi:hypothetical protein